MEDTVGIKPQNVSRHTNIACEAAILAEAQDGTVLAVYKMASCAGRAFAAGAGGVVRYNAIADLPLRINLVADFTDHTGKLMARNEFRVNAGRGLEVPCEKMQITAADADCLDFDDHIFRPANRFVFFLENKLVVLCFIYQCFHTLAPSIISPAFSKVRRCLL